jgi:hypothetical protein
MLYRKPFRSFPTHKITPDKTTIMLDPNTASAVQIQLAAGVAVEVASAHEQHTSEAKLRDTKVESYIFHMSVT